MRYIALQGVADSNTEVRQFADSLRYPHDTTVRDNTSQALSWQDVVLQTLLKMHYRPSAEGLDHFHQQRHTSTINKTWPSAW